MPRFVPGKQLLVQRFVLGRHHSDPSCFFLIAQLRLVRVCFGLAGSSNIQLGLVRSGWVLLGLVVPDCVWLSSGWVCLCMVSPGWVWFGPVGSG